MRSTATSPSSFDRENAPSASVGPVAPLPRIQAPWSETRSPARRGRDPEAVRARGAPHEPERILDVDSVSLGENPLGQMSNRRSSPVILRVRRSRGSSAARTKLPPVDFTRRAAAARTPIPTESPSERRQTVGTLDRDVTGRAGAVGRVLEQRTKLDDVRSRRLLSRLCPREHEQAACDPRESDSAGPAAVSPGLCSSSLVSPKARLCKQPSGWVARANA
jgi:hypothetical protein